MWRGQSTKHWVPGYRQTPTSPYINEQCDTLQSTLSPFFPLQVPFIQKLIEEVNESIHGSAHHNGDIASAQRCTVSVFAQKEPVLR